MKRSNSQETKPATKKVKSNNYSKPDDTAKPISNKQTVGKKQAINKSKYLIK